MFIFYLVCEFSATSNLAFHFRGPSKWSIYQQPDQLEVLREKVAWHDACLNCFHFLTAFARGVQRAGAMVWGILLRPLASSCARRHSVVHRLQRTFLLVPFVEVLVWVAWLSSPLSPSPCLAFSHDPEPAP